MEITWLGHSTFQWKLSNGETAVVDPWIQENPKYPKGHKFDRIDLILVSHGHYDHSSDAAGIAKQFHAPVICMFELAVWLKSKGVETAQGGNKGGTQTVGSFQVTLTHAFHSSSVQDGGEVIYTGEPAGFIVRLAGGMTVYFAGDTTVFGDMALIGEVYRPDVAFLPIGDFYTMGPTEAAKAIELLKVPRVVPMHWGTFPALTGTPQELQKLTRAEVLLPTIGEPLSL